MNFRTAYKKKSWRFFVTNFRIQKRKISLKKYISNKTDLYTAALPAGLYNITQYKEDFCGLQTNCLIFLMLFAFVFTVTLDLTNIKGDWLTDVFARFLPAARFCFEFWLVHPAVYFCCNWSEASTLVLVSRHWKTSPKLVHTISCSLPLNSALPFLHSFLVNNIVIQLSLR